jgi:hypothetical protein
MRARFLGLVLVASCPHPPPPMPISDCTAAIVAFVSADPARIVPLPSSCTAADVATALHPPDATSLGMLGKRDHRMKLHWFVSGKLARIRAWIDPAGRVVLLDAEWPPAPLEQYIKVLGQPDHRLDYAWSGTVLERGELLWLSRGVVIVASPGVTGIVRAGIFTPTSLDDYERELQLVEGGIDDEG